MSVAHPETYAGVRQRAGAVLLDLLGPQWMWTGHKLQDLHPRSPGQETALTPFLLPVTALHAARGYTLRY